MATSASVVCLSIAVARHHETSSRGPVSFWPPPRPARSDVTLVLTRPMCVCRERWRETVKHGDAVADLKRAVRYNGESSPCVSGCRSVCWKVGRLLRLRSHCQDRAGVDACGQAFLLLRDAPSPSADWVGILAESRAQYADRRDHLLKFIKHPELLTELAVDPLADDPDVSSTTSESAPSTRLTSRLVAMEHGQGGRGHPGRDRAGCAPPP